MQTKWPSGRTTKPPGLPRKAYSSVRRKADDSGGRAGAVVTFTGRRIITAGVTISKDMPMANQEITIELARITDGRYVGSNGRYWLELRVDLKYHCTISGELQYAGPARIGSRHDGGIGERLVHEVPMAKPMVAAGGRAGLRGSTRHSKRRVSGSGMTLISSSTFALFQGPKYRIAESENEKGDLTS